MEEHPMDISLKISKLAPQLRGIYGLLETEMISAILVPTSYPTTFHPTMATTRQYTLPHQKNLDDEILSGSQENSAGLPNIAFIVVIVLAGLVALLSCWVLILKMRCMCRNTVTTSSVRESEFSRSAHFVNLSISSKTDHESECNDVAPQDIRTV